MSVLSDVTWIDIVCILVGITINTILIGIVAHIISMNYELKTKKKNQKKASCTMYIISELVWIDVLFITVGVVANAVVITFIVYFITKLYKLRKIQMNLMKRTCPEAPSEVFRNIDQSKPIMEKPQLSQH